MKKLSIVFLSILLSVSVIAGNVSPKGEFATIDVKTQNKTFKKLSKSEASYIETVLEKPEMKSQ